MEFKTDSLVLESVNRAASKKMPVDKECVYSSCVEDPLFS